MSGSPPTTLGKYQIIREIARSNDIVYEAYDQLMNRRVALKELAMPGGSTPQQRDDRIKRFLREARAAGSLAHPNIMTVYEVGQEGDRYFIALEYLDGKTLRNELDTKGFLPTERAVEIATAVLEGLEYAHSKGVIHRDIKPDNIQILSGGTIKLTDFGIARLTFEPNLTMDGQVFGTPSYMSPEQVVGRDIDARSDLFSVGVVLYEMLAGVKPFPGDSVVTITYGIMNKTPDRPQQINWSLWQVVEKALDKSPQLRYRSAREFIEAIQSAMQASQSVVLDPKAAQPPPLYQQPQAYQPQPQPLYNYGQPQQQNYGGQPQQQYGNANPYGNQQPMQAPYIPGMGTPPVIGQMGGAPPGYGMQVPVYYPPPPRKPLFVISPQSKRFMAELFVYLVALATIAGLIVALFNGCTTIAERNASQIHASAGKAPASRPADPADDWNSRGIAAESRNDFKEAERDFTQATTRSPNDPDGFLHLGQLYTSMALQTGDATEDSESNHLELLRLAASNFEISASLERDTGKKNDAYGRAAHAWLDRAQLLHDGGRVDEARKDLAKALPDADGDPDLHSQISTLFQTWSGTN
jgi:serine/threonine protein kinase